MPKDVNPGLAAPRPATRAGTPAVVGARHQRELRKALGFDGDPSKPLIGEQSEAQDAPAPFDEISDISEPRREKGQPPAPRRNQ